MVFFIRVATTGLASTSCSSTNAYSHASTHLACWPVSQLAMLAWSVAPLGVKEGKTCTCAQPARTAAGYGCRVCCASVGVLEATLPTSPWMQLHVRRVTLPVARACRHWTQVLRQSCPCSLSRACRVGRTCKTRKPLCCQLSHSADALVPYPVLFCAVLYAFCVGV